MASEVLIELASSVADLQRVDWAEAQASGNVVDLGAIEQLRILAEIARVHRAMLEDSAAADAPDPTQSDGNADGLPFEWGALRVLQKLGSGSFGEVFRAWDASLDREVALKLLRPGLPSSQQTDVIISEGYMLARVRHPNVMAVYGAQSFEGRVGIWGEFLRGRTLADIVERDGPLGAQEASICTDAICRALSAVHRAGLLHRDVKAQNVMREAGGRIVLMDLGLGREFERIVATSGPELAGTPAYLAPELLEGMPASVRSDVYSIGVLLFFLLTGSFPVEASSLDELVRSHRSRKQQRLQDLRSDLPAALNEVVERALAPDPTLRFESAGALQSALAGAMYGMQPRTDSVRARIMTLAATGGLVAGVVLSAVIFLVLDAGAPPPEPYALSFSPPPGLRFTQGARNVPAIAPDGKRIAFVATDAKGVTQLWVRSIGDPDATAVVGSPSASGPFWSPDGQSLAFFTSSGLHRVSLSGARSEKLAEVWESRGATWGRHDKVVLAARHLDGLWQMASAGGALTQITKVNFARGELAHMWPQFLPDGRLIFFVDASQESVRGVYLLALDGNHTRVLANDASALHGDGQLFFVRDSKLFAQPFDTTAGRIAGTPVALAEQVGVTYNLQSAISVSDQGTIVYAHRARDFRRLVWYNLSGGELSVVAPPEKYRNPTLSRDGRYLAVEWYDALSEVRIFDLVRGGWTLLRAGYQSLLPAFGPNHQLALSLGRGDLYRLNIDEPSPASLVLTSSEDKETTDWSHDGRVIVFAAIGNFGYRKLWVVSPGERAARRLVPPRADVPAPDRDHHEAQGRFSPDGRSIAYLSSRSGRSEIYVRTPWQSATEKKVSVEGGYNPVWRSNDEVLYLDPSGTLYLAAVGGRTDSALGVAPPRRLFKSAVDTPGASRNHYVLSPDGMRVLFAEPVQDASATPFAVLANWRAIARASQ